MGRHSLSVIVALAILVLLAPCPAPAQYMYLDSNGDGIHSDADVIHGAGQTEVTVWLNTNHRRDGTEVACVTQDGPLELMGTFAAVVQASGGTFTCTNPSSLQPLMSSPYVILGTTECHIGYIGPVHLGTGLFPLARFTLTVASGTPSVSIVDHATTIGSLPKDLITEFGSSCSGLSFDNTMKLGQEWFDADGLAYASGGDIGSPPTIPPIAAFVTTTGQFLSRDVSISDADGQTIQSHIEGGPGFVSLANLLSAPGSFDGRIHVQPRHGDEGSYDPQLTASDGENQSTQPFHVAVASGPNHGPSLRSVTRIDVVAGTVARRSLWASDSDGDPVTFTKVSGPDFADVASVASGRGGAGGLLTLRPTLCDVGDAPIVVSVSDGTAASMATIPIEVRAPAPAPQAPVHEASTGDHLYDLATGDFNEDGHQDVATIDEANGAMTLLAGDGTGDLTVIEIVNLGGIGSAIVAGDFNQDGHRDLASGAADGSGLRVFYGRGDGTFSAPVHFPEVVQTRRLILADLNLDAIDDLIAFGMGEASFVLLGSPSGLSSANRLQGIPLATAATVADFDGDGLPDLAISMPNPRQVAFLSGRGDGTFTESHNLPMAPDFPSGLVAGDWDADGRIDLAAVDEDFGVVHRIRNEGDGAFSVSTIHSFGFITIYDAQVLDWNADGYQDLIFCADGLPSATILMGGAGGTFASAALNPNLFSTSRARAADFNEDGRPDLVGCGGTWVRVVLNPNTTPTGVLARAFSANGKMITVVPSSRTLDVYLEPSNATFTAQDIDPASLRMVSDGTGSVSSIGALVSKGTTISDTDHNGVPELAAPFRMEDVAHLFAGLRGKTVVSVRMQATLLDSRRLCAPLTMTLYVTGGGALAARIEPNPLNPQGTLKFTVSKTGPVSVRLFDVKGRLVKTLWERRQTDPGDQELVIDGRLPSGQPMSTGVYFYRIETDGTSTNGRFAVLK